MLQWRHHSVDDERRFLLRQYYVHVLRSTLVTGLCIIYSMLCYDGIWTAENGSSFLGFKLIGESISQDPLRTAKDTFTLHNHQYHVSTTKDCENHKTPSFEFDRISQENKSVHFWFLLIHLATLLGRTRRSRSVKCRPAVKFKSKTVLRNRC